MIRVGILGDIGSGKTFVAKNFGYPVFNADLEVSKLYKKDLNVFKKFKKLFPNYIKSFPINKNQVVLAILQNKNNLKRIVKVVHPEIRKKLNIFLKKNKKKKIVILDIPLLLENRIYNKRDILVFIQSNKSNILKKLKKRDNYNKTLLSRFKKIQFSLDFKKKKSHFIIKNNFKKKEVKKNIRDIIKKILQ